MSDTFIDFKAIDYTGNESLSTYSLSSTPLLFYPEFKSFSDNKNRIVWDFGDGTISKSTSAYKHYNFPGKYNVRMVMYDCDNNALLSYFDKEIIVYDFIPLTFNLKTNSRLIDFYGNYIVDTDGSYIISENPDPLTFVAGKASSDIEFNMFYPQYQKPLDIYYTVSGSNSENYFNLENKYSHLQNSYVFYDKFYNNYIKEYQYREIDKIIPQSTNLYAKILNDQIVFCDRSDNGSFFVGASAHKTVFFKDDSLSDLLRITFKYDKTKYQIPIIDGYVDYLNNLGISLSASVIDNEPSYLSITSNGLDGEGIVIDSFNINNIKYFESDIPFIVKIKDFENYSLKTFNSLELSSLSIKIFGTLISPLLTEGGDQLYTEDGYLMLQEQLTYLPSSAFSISNLNYTLSSIEHGGSFRGSFKINKMDYPFLNAIISLSSTLNKGLSTYNLSGKSNYFNIYPLNYYDIYKKNENFQANSVLKDLIFQEILIDKNVFFDDFAGGILGNDNYDHETIGTKIYEKIANFVGNTQYLDTCEIDFLNSLCQYIGYNDINEENYNYPNKIKRLMNILSINKNKLFGTLNKFNQNFDTRGNITKDKYGKNLGNLINDPTNYNIIAGNHIVALEKFSNEYTLLNTYQPVSAVSSYNYPLSSYSSDWGWPLVLPSSFNFSDISKYYLFFESDLSYDGSVLGGVFDFENEKTNITKDLDTEEINEIIDNMILSTLYSSLSLIK